MVLRMQPQTHVEFNRGKIRWSTHNHEWCIQLICQMRNEIVVAT